MIASIRNGFSAGMIAYVSVIGLVSLLSLGITVVSKRGYLLRRRQSDYGWMVDRTLKG